MVFLRLHKRARGKAADAEDNVDQKMNLYLLSYESRDALKSFSLFLTVKTISRLNMDRTQR